MNNKIDSLSLLETELLKTKCNTWWEEMNSDILEAIFFDILGKEPINKNISKIKKRIIDILQECLKEDIPTREIFTQLKWYDNLPDFSKEKVYKIYEKYQSYINKNFKNIIPHELELEKDFRSIYYYIKINRPQIKIKEIIETWENEFIYLECKLMSMDPFLDTLKVIVFLRYMRELNVQLKFN